MMILIALVLGLGFNFLFNGTVGVLTSMAYVSYALIKRNLEIKKLNLYLKQINSGKSHYDISDYKEGELSILRSELSKTTLMLQTTNEKLIQQQEFLYNSLSDISHQLKTPLTGMTLMNEVLLSKVDGDSKEFVLESQSQVERLEWLVVSLLKLIQLEAESIVLVKEPVQSRKLIESTLHHISLDKEVNLIGDDVLIRCDLQWTQEALINILNNKNRYANKVITIETSRNRLNTMIRISDDGSEIKISEREKLFERFYKGEQASSESVGIGLALSKEIIVQQGFHIFIEDKNTFVIVINDETVTSD